MEITAYDLASRFVGTAEVDGLLSNPQILAFLRLDAPEIADDLVPWCSAFVNWIAWLLRLPRSKSLAARSWLNVGTPIDLRMAQVGFDVVILERGGPTAATGHVGFYAGRQTTGVSEVLLLGGNQGNRVSLAPFGTGKVLGVRRLRPV